MRIRRFLLVFLGVALVGCGRDTAAPSATWVDLLEALPDARWLGDALVLDIGTPGARPALGDGWSFDETSDDGETFAWGVGSASSIEVLVPEAWDVVLVLRGRPYVYPEATPQVVSAQLNGQLVGRAELPENGGELRFFVPATAWNSGSNVLTLGYAYSVRPADHSDTEDPRPLAVAWSSLQLHRPSAPPEDAVQSIDSRMLLADGTRLDYFLRLPAGSALAVEQVARMPHAPDPSSAGAVVVEVARDDAPPLVAELAVSADPQVVPVTDEESIVRLSLRTEIPTDDGEVKLVLDRPRIVAPQPSPEPAEGPRLASAEPAGRPNIVVYLVDTLRADRLGCYGYDRAVSPHVDAFAGQAIVFDDAIAQSPWTRPSVASLLTGLRPETHGVEGRKHKLAADVVSLVEVLRDGGYDTAGLVSNPNAAGWYGLRQGFDAYRLLGKKKTRARRMNREVERWLDARTSEAPFFLYLHTVDPHGPYNAGAAYRQQFAAATGDPALRTRAFLRRLARQEVESTPQVARQLSDLYDAEVAMNDAAFGGLLEILKRRGLYEETIVVFVSDHGEEFLEHGRWEHAKSLYTEVIDVPLILRLPGHEPRRVAWPVQHADVLPTILAYVGLEVPARVEGRNLLPMLDDPSAVSRGHGYVLSSVDQGNYQGRSVTTARYRLIVPGSLVFGTGLELYDRLEDPGETRNLAVERPVLAGYLRSLLAAGSNGAEVPEIDEAEMDPEILERLRALGYME